MILSTLFRILAALLLVLMLDPPVRAATPDGQRLILVTLDGMRWQDVFRGPDAKLVEDSHYTDEDLKESVTLAWSGPGAGGRLLMPFLHDVVAAQGVLTGDRDHGQCARVANDMWFSYPGYNEILTGKPDPRIDSNDKIPNRNVTFLEWLNRRPDFAGKIAAVGTWDVFPFIINTQRSGVPVNAAFGHRHPTDALTERFAMDLLRTTKPRILYIGFGDTDELAHAGDYDQYLAAANRVDEFLRRLWDFVQADPAYRGRTTLIVTTDHGRGDQSDVSWTEHSSRRYLEMYPTYMRDYNATGIPGSDAIWIGAIGPGVRHADMTVRPGDCLLQSQIAASALTALGLDWHAFDPQAGAPLPFFGR